MEVRPQEQRLIELAGELPSGRVLCNSAGRGQLAVALAGQADRDVTCWLLDLYQLREAERSIGCLPANLRFVCEADPPAEQFAAAALALSRKGDAELSRELLQTAHERLVIGGRLAVAIDHAADKWMHEQLRSLFGKVTRRPLADAVVYLATKSAALKKHKDYACELAFRDGERLIHLRTRPSVFSHREVDGGARALVKSMEIEPDMRVLDLGCGSGAVGLAATLRVEAVRAHATDSNPRAIEAVQWAAERNGVTSQITAALDCDGSSVKPGTFEIVLANPPYYSSFRIAALFVAIAHRALIPGGRLLIVTKTPKWYEAELPKQFGSIDIRTVGQYQIVSAVKG